MNLTKANIKALRKVTVKIECSNNNKGSGIIVSVGENLYVLTAAHIIGIVAKHLESSQLIDC